MLCVILFCCIGRFMDESPSLSQVLDAWENGCNNLHSYNIYVTGTQSTLRDYADGKYLPSAAPLKEERSSHQIFQDGKRRIESGVKIAGMNPSTIIIWDKESARTYVPVTQELTIEPNLTLTTPNGFQALDYAVLNRMATGSLDRIQIMRERPESKIERREGDQFVIYTPSTQRRVNYAPFGFRIWLDSTKDFLPKKIQHLLAVDDKEIVFAQIENTLSKVAPGIWAITESVVTGYPPRAKDPTPGPSTITNVKLDLENSRFECPVSESEFQLAVPVGIRVHNKISGKTYITANALGKAAHLTELVMQSKDATETLNARSGSLDTQQTGMLRTRNLIILNCGMMALFAAVLVLRRRQARPTAECKAEEVGK
jgi:hypothetical protein